MAHNKYYMGNVRSQSQIDDKIINKDKPDGFTIYKILKDRERSVQSRERSGSPTFAQV